MSLRHALAAALCLALTSAATPAHAEDAQFAVRPENDAPVIVLLPTGEPGVVEGKFSTDVTARVHSIDLAKREVTLNVDGKKETMVAGPEVKNLEKLERGDRVRIRYRAGLVLRLQAPGKDDVKASVEKEVTPTGRGDVMSGVETVRARATLTVTAIDPATKVVTLAGPKGRTHAVKAGEGVSLDHVKVGDKVAATYSAAMAVSVDPTYKPQR